MKKKINTKNAFKNLTKNVKASSKLRGVMSFLQDPFLLSKKKQSIFILCLILSRLSLITPSSPIHNYYCIFQSRCSVKEKVTSARPRVSEVSVLPPIDMGWSNVPTDGCYTGPLNYRWQRVADNFIDSDLRLRSRYGTLS